MKFATPILFAVISLAWLGCEAPPADVAPKPDPAAVTTAAAAAEKPKPAAHEHEVDEGCGDHDKAAADTSVRTGKDPKSGAEMKSVGANLAGVEVVTVKDLVAKPDSYSGKVVRVEGDVNAMCHHRRGWFSVQDEGERGGTFVRVITSPTFLVPAGMIGKKARAEGKVEVIEVPAAAARHYAKDHKIGDENVEGPVKQVIIRATGAEFVG